METAFLEAKNALADATLLVHPNENAPTALTVDASQQAIGGVLEQYVEGVWRRSVYSPGNCVLERQNIRLSTASYSQLTSPLGTSVISSKGALTPFTPIKIHWFVLYDKLLILGLVGASINFRPFQNIRPTFVILLEKQMQSLMDCQGCYQHSRDWD